MTTLTVGSGEQYGSLSAAIAASNDGDVIQVQAGTYTNDFSEITTQITIEGVGGMVDLVATEPPTNEKGILTTDTNVTIENVSFSGSTITSDEGGNGAGVRYQGGTLTLINDDFHDNQNGILGNPVVGGSIDIQSSTFEDNGSGSGYTHDIYVGDIASFTLENSTVASAVVGHEVKSRAESNTIIGNTIEDGPTGTSSYEIDLPDGGNDLVENNVIEKGPNAQNDYMVHFGGEGIPYASSNLTLSGNTFVNDLGPAAIAVLNQTIIPVVITGNTFDAMAASEIVSGAATETNNVSSDGTSLANGTTPVGSEGNSEIFTDSNPHTVTLTQSNFVVEGGGGLLTVSAPAGHVTVTGGSGGLVFTDVDAGGDYITTAAGATDTVTLSGEDTVNSAGTDVVNFGPSNSVVQATGNATLNGGAGSNAYTVTGDDVIDVAGGSDTVGVMSTAQVRISGTETFLELSDLGGQVRLNVTEGGAKVGASISGGAINLVSYNGTVSATTAGGSAGVLLKLGAGTDQIVSVGADTIYAGPGTDTVIVSGAAQIHAGTGTLDVFGRGDTAGATVFGGAGTYLISGDTGNIKFIGGAARAAVEATLSNITVQGGAGRLSISGGGGREVIVGGKGGIDFTTTAGADAISTASGATDRITLSAASIVNSLGNDCISGGAGNQTITAFGKSTIMGSTGSSTYTLNGNEVLTSLSQSTDTILVGAGAQARVSTSTAALINLNDVGGTVTFTDTAGGDKEALKISGTMTLTAYAGAPAAITTAARGGSTITLTTGNAVLNSQGADTISVGAANATVNGSGTSTVHGGTGSFNYSGSGGSMMFVGGSGNASIDGSGSAVNIMAGSGNITLTSGSAASNFVAGSGAATVTEGSGAATVQLGSGGTSVTGGSGTDLYQSVAGKGGGSDIIQGFKVGQDQLTLTGFSTNPVANEQVVGGSFVISLTDNTQITLAGVSSLAPNSLQISH